MRELRWMLGLVLLCLGGLGGCQGHPAGGLSREEFVHAVSNLSERPGFFDTDNLISNESGYLHPVPKLKELDVTGGAYLGVGPDQNFTYIAKVRPELALIVDIRRDNLLHHLLFKALFAMAGNRAEFLSLLFSKPLAPGSSNATLEQLIEHFEKTPGDPQLHAANLERLTWEVRRSGVFLSEDYDIPRIQAIYEAFYKRHLGLRFEFNSQVLNALTYPSFKEFLLGRTLEGEVANFLNSDEEFAFLKDMQEKNLIVPIVGNFAGPKALAAIAAYLRSRALTVSVFYTSNVEYYLLPDQELDEDMEYFVDNLSLLPMNDKSVLIRAYLNEKEGLGEATRRPHPHRRGSELFTTTLHSLPGFVASYQSGKYRNYWDIVVDDIPLQPSETPR